MAEKNDQYEDELCGRFLGGTLAVVGGRYRLYFEQRRDVYKMLVYSVLGT